MSLLYETSAEVERRGNRRPPVRVLDSTPPAAGAANLLSLQRTVGNAAVNTLMRDLGGDIANAVETMTDVASFQLTLIRHLGNRATIERWIEEGLASVDDRRLQNSCQWIKQGRMKLFVLTRTHDSPTRAAAAGHPQGAAYFSYPAGEIYAPPVFYARRDGTAAFDDTNVHFEDGTGVDGFQSAGEIALMESAIANGRDYLWSVLKHEIQHASDDHGDTDLEGYRTEFRAYWLGSGEYNDLSPTRRVYHMGHEWNERQWAIFNRMYNDNDAYGYVKKAWDADEAQPDRRKRTFQIGVRAFSRPASINAYNSPRIEDFYRSVMATSHADCDADSAASPNPAVQGVRGALAALEPADLRDIRRNDSFTRALRAHLKGHLLHEVYTAVGN
ncbi:MAG: hypothetical protein ABJB93_07530 [Gaiellales bacterium]